jgi:hypothetical protein
VIMTSAGDVLRIAHSMNMNFDRTAAARARLSLLAISRFSASLQLYMWRAAAENVESELMSDRVVNASDQPPSHCLSP